MFGQNNKFLVSLLMIYELRRNNLNRSYENLVFDTYFNVFTKFSEVFLTSRNY